MTTKQLKTMPITRLQALHAKAGAMLKARQNQIAAAKKKVLSIAKQLGMTARELGELASRRGPDKKPRKSPSRKTEVEAKPAKAKRSWTRRAGKENGADGEQHATRH
jgi:hypothetical protein